MDDTTMNGVIAYDDSRHDDYLFRISVKAIVVNGDGRILVVKETGRDWWDFPGGGLDHGESIKEALSRELYEEVGFKGDIVEYEPIHVSEPHILHEFNMYQMRLTFLVKTSNLNFEPGIDGDEVMFADPNDFKNSTSRTDRNLYEYSQLALMRRGLIK